MLTNEIRAAIKACHGTLSLGAAAKRFGVSRRTIGRIYHGGELSQARNYSSAEEVDTLREQVSKLSELVLALGKQIEGMASHQRYRQALNPNLHSKSFLSHQNDFSSPYRDSPGIPLINVYGIQVPVPSYGWREQCAEAWFIAQHPVSPDCTKYPYPQPQPKKTAAKILEAAAPVTYRDPPSGMSCTCEDCQSWRLDLAYESAIMRAYPIAVSKLAVFRAYR